MIFKYSQVLLTTFIAAATATTDNADKTIPNKEGRSSSTLSPRTLRSTQVVDVEEKDINTLHPSDVLATIADDNDTLHSVGGSKMGLRRLKNVFDPDTKSSKAKINKRNKKANKCKDSSYIAPDCDWSQGETFIYDGTNGECVVPPSAHKERPLWYSLEEGTCNVLQVNSTHLEFDVHRTETGILFSSEPHKYVLDPEESDKFSDLSLFKDKAVSILIKGGDIGEILFVGVLDMTAEGSGLITGKKIHGDLDLSHDTSTTSSFVLGSVDRVRAWSAVGLGMCSSDGQGRVSIEVDDFVSFKEDRFDPGFPMKFFENVNAAIFSDNLGYEVFTIDKVENSNRAPGSPVHSGSMEGKVYFSTKIGTWDTKLGPSNSEQERCFIFVDATDVYSKDQVKTAADDYCDPDKNGRECSVFGYDCLNPYCECQHLVQIAELIFPVIIQTAKLVFMVVFLMEPIKPWLSGMMIPGIVLEQV